MRKKVKSDVGYSVISANKMLARGGMDALEALFDEQVARSRKAVG